MLTTAPHRDVDALDLRILAALREDPEAAVKDLAAAVGIPSSTCAFRLRALRRRGVVSPSRLRVEPAAVGAAVQAMIRVRLGTHSKDGVQALFDALTATPGVLQVFHIAGADDFLVHVAVADAAALRDIVLERITVHAVVRATETQLVFELREGVGVLPLVPVGVTKAMLRAPCWSSVAPGAPREVSSTWYLTVTDAPTASGPDQVRRLPLRVGALPAVALSEPATSVPASKTSDRSSMSVAGRASV